jgi:hypothetical protein
LQEKAGGVMPAGLFLLAEAESLVAGRDGASGGVDVIADVAKLIITVRAQLRSSQLC